MTIEKQISDLRAFVTSWLPTRARKSNKEGHIHDLSLHLGAGTILQSTASGNLTLTASYQDVSGATVTLPSVGDWLITAAFAFSESGTGDEGQLASGQLLVDGVAQTPIAFLDLLDGIQATVVQTWKVTTAAADLIAKLQAKKQGGTGTSVAGANTTITASGGSLGSTASPTTHGSLGGLSNDDHTQYRLESADHSHQSTGLEAGQLTVAALSDAPAGELGGTWAAPTVDATHSGSAHHTEAHNIFSSAHADTTGAAAPVDGDVVIGNVTPKWSKLARSVPAINQRNVLGIDNAELRPSWKTLLSDANPVDISDAAFSGEQTPAARDDHEHRGVLSVAGPSAVPIYGAALFDASGGLIGVSQAGQTITWGLTSADVVVPGSADYIALHTQTINFVIDGGGSAITTGVKGYLVVDFACTVTAWTLLGDNAGNTMTIDVWNDTYANFPPTVADTMITTGTKPALAGIKGQDTTVDWADITIAAGSILAINVDAVGGTAPTRVTLALTVTRT